MLVGIGIIIVAIVVVRGKYNTDEMVSLWE
jgi:hypothetical protein